MTENTPEWEKELKKLERGKLTKEVAGYIPYDHAQLFILTNFISKKELRKDLTEITNLLFKYQCAQHIKLHKALKEIEKLCK